MAKTCISHDHLRNMKQILDDLNEMKKILCERLGKQFGKGTKPDLNMILGNLDEISKFQRKHEQNLAMITTDLVLVSSRVDSLKRGRRSGKKASKPIRDQDNKWLRS